MEEMREKGGGLVRLGMAQKELVHESQLDAAIGVPLILRIIAPIGADASAKSKRPSTFFGYVGESLPLSQYQANRGIHSRYRVEITSSR
jgi:hypothetical protein